MKRFWPYFTFILIWIVFSYPFFFQGKTPAPLDFLVNFFAPWDKYFDSPVKNPAISDVVNQVIPWKTFTAWSLKRGEIPLWNPYNLAGAPHLANWQSGVLYPTNLLFLFLPFITAWSLHVLLQPLFAGLFTILFLRSLSLSQISSLLGALAFSYGGFMTTWMEWGTLGHALLWLPLALYGVEQGRRKKKEGRRYFLSTFLIVFSWVMSLFAGHLQISLYVIAVTIAYLFFGTRSVFSFKKSSLTACSLLLTTLLISVPQLLPTLQLYSRSYRSSSIDEEWFKNFRIPLYGLATFVAPDFFGNPVTRNHWSDHSYVEMMGYVGIAPFLFALSAIFHLKRSDLPVSEGRTLRNVRNFFIGVILVSFALSLKTPLANILIWLKIPVLNSSSPARIIGVATFSLAVLAAIGMDEFILLIKKKMWKPAVLPLSFLSISFLVLWLWAFFSGHEFSHVSQRNLILPTVIFGIVCVGILLSRFLHKRFSIRFPSLLSTSYYLLILLISSFELMRFHHKFTPFTDRQFFYPEIPVIRWLEDHPDRTFGLFDANLNLPFRIATVEGYDPLVLGDYVQYTSVAETGDVVLPKRTSAVQLPKNGKDTMRILNELGVKYIVQPTVHGAQPWELRLWEYSGQFDLVYADDEYEVYRNRFARSPIEPAGSMKETQKRLFQVGAGGTLIGLLLIGLGYFRYQQSMIHDL